MQRALSILLLAAAIGSAPASTTRAQTEGIGLHVGAALNLHAADFTELPGIPNWSPGFRSGSGLAPTLFAVWRQRLSSELLLDLRGGWFEQSARLERLETTSIEYDNEPLEVTIVHAIDARIASVALEPMVGYRLAERLVVEGGAHVGLRVVGEYDQEEKLGDEVRRGTFENGRRARNESSGELPNLRRLDLGLVAAISWELPLNHAGTVMAIPELAFVYGLGSPVEGIDWSTHAVRLGIQFQYRLRERSSPADPAVEFR